ncbi:glycine betaine ABC transport system, permease protein OpuAB [Paenibacillus sp. JCM 10914]|nr:glycine betaine ABC transport system, permease protein OpuAB [Paenibacillus sp. JCM 10914]
MVGDVFSGFFDMISSLIQGVVQLFTDLFMLPHPYLFIVILAVIAYLLGKLPLTLFTAIGFLLIDNLGYWSHTMSTLSLVITAALISVLLGVPLGIWAAYSKTASRIIIPILDFMQTMPAFVYLLPAVTFFSLASYPGLSLPLYSRFRQRFA